MPGGHDGFLKLWGYMQFAQAIEDAVRHSIRIDDRAELIDELQWCIENGSHGPRTEVVLRWALETVEAAEQSIREAEMREKS